MSLLVILPVALILLLLLLVQLGLRGSHGNLPALIAGQFEPEPKQLRRDASLTGGKGRTPYAVQVWLDLERPVAEVPER